LGEDVAVVGPGDEVGAGKVAEVDLYSIVAHVKDLGKRVLKNKYLIDLRIVL